MHVSTSPLGLRARLLIAGVAAAAVCAAIGNQPARSAYPWTDEIGSVLRAYVVGDYDAAQLEARQVAARSRDPRARFDAAVLEAMCLAHTASRGDWRDARTRLAALMAEDRRLEQDPECSLAYGIILTALDETAEALHRIDVAVEEFLSTGQTERAKQALVALARTWAGHGEWELTRQRFGVTIPSSAAEADAMRQRKIDEIRARLRQLPASEEELVAVDVALGRRLLASEASHAAGLALLEPLLDAPTWSSARVEAASVLAEWYEEAGQADRALPIWRRLAESAGGLLGQRAATRVTELGRPKVEIIAPGEARPQQPVAVGFKARGVAAMTLEVRAFDIERWLSGTPRGSDALLPESGPLHAARDLRREAGDSEATWDATSPPALEATLPTGVYAILAHGRSDDGRTILARQLLSVSDLSAACLVGPRSVVVWATQAGSDGTRTAPPRTDGGPSVRFWMQRSFRPVEANLDGGLARFDLPAEARVMRERGWVCVVRVADHYAVVRGQLPPEPEGAALPRLALFAPSTVPYGQPLPVAGLLAGTSPISSSLDIEVRDAFERVVARRPLPVVAGTVHTELACGSELAGSRLRVVPRLAERVIDNAAGRLLVSVAERPFTPLHVDVDWPAWSADPGGGLAGEVRVTHPWGPPARGAAVVCSITTLELPAARAAGQPQPGPSVLREGLTDACGRLRIALSPEELTPARAPLAVRVAAWVGTSEGASGVGAAETLLAESPRHAWLSFDPPTPSVGVPLHVEIGVYEPGGPQVIEPPRLAVRRAGRPVTELAVQPGPSGWRSEPWTPTSAGPYELVAAFQGAGEPWAVSASCTVQPTDSDSAGTEATRADVALRLEPHAGGMHIVLTAPASEEWLVIAEDGDVLDARPVPPGADRATLEWTNGASATRSVRVRLLAWGADRLHTLAEQRLPSMPGDTTGLELGPLATPAWPGTEFAAPVRSTSGSSAAHLVARLVASAEVGRSPVRTDTDGERGGLALHVSGGSPAVRGSAARSNTLLSRTASESMPVDGTTLWCWAGELAPGSALPVRVPDWPGRFALRAHCADAAGGLAPASVLIDTSRSPRCRINVPEVLVEEESTLVSVRVDNPGSTPLRLTLELDIGAGLQVADAGGVSASAWRSWRDEGRPMALAVPPGGTRWLQLLATAQRTGHHVLRVALRDGDTTRRFESPYEVVADTEPSPAHPTADAYLPVTRTVRLWTPPEAAAPLLRPAPSLAAGGLDAVIFDAEALRRSGWTVADWAPGQSLTVGQILEVRDEIDAEFCHPALVWSQPLPANCVYVAPEAARTAKYGQATTVRRQVATREPLRPTDDPCVHTFCLGVARPGESTLPVPRITNLGRPNVVRLEGPRGRVIVPWSASDRVTVGTE